MDDRLTRAEFATWLRARADRIWSEFEASRGGNQGGSASGQSHRQRDRHEARVRELRQAAEDVERGPG